MKSNFNVYHFFAGAFVPSWLLSRQELGAGAKLTYAMLAQQANSSGVAQLNFQMQGVALGEPDGQLAHRLMQLEEVGLIQVSHGNVHTEDIRVFFPRHRWMVGLEAPPQHSVAQPITAEAATLERLVPEGATSTQSSLLPTPPAVGLDVRSNGRERKGRRKRRPPQSKHTFEVCLQFVTYQKEILHHDHIWNVTGLARHLHLSGEQDDEIDSWLTEQASNAA